MPGLIKVLLVEDNEEDAELLLRHLRTKGMPAECLRVASAAAMRSALNEGTWDVILADYTMPGFSGLEAIKIAQADPKKVPVILVSGSIGETLAVEAMKAGAHDYLMKDSLARLIPAIQHAIENRHNQEEIEKAELSLRESEEKFRQMAENIHQVFWIQDAKTLDFIYVSPAYEEIFGRPIQDLYKNSMAFLESFHPEDLKLAIELTEKNRARLKSGKPITLEGQREYRIIRPDGQLVWVSADTFPIYNKDGELIRGVGIAEDITERKRVEKAIADDRNFLDNVFNSIQDGMSVLDENLVIQRVNPTFEKWFGPKETLVGKICHQALYQNNEICKDCSSVRAMATGEAFSTIKPRMNLDGKAIGWQEVHSSPIKDQATGKITGVIEFSRDITDRLRAEEKIHKMAGQLRNIATSARQLTSVLDPNLLSQQIVKLLREITPSYSANLFLKQADDLIVTASEGEYEGVGTQIGIRLDLNKGIIGYVARTGMPVLEGDVHKNENYMFFEKLPDTLSELAVPIKKDNEVLGVLDIQSKELHAFDVSDMEALVIFADQMAVAIQNARLFDETRRRARELEMVTTISTALRAATSRSEIPPIVLEQLTSQLNAESAALIWIDNSTGQMIIEQASGAWKHLQGIELSDQDATKNHMIIPTGTLIENDVAASITIPVVAKQNLKAMASAAMIVEGKTTGNLWIGRTEPISEEDAKLLAVTAEITAIAMHRTALNEQTRRRLAHITALQNIDQFITSSFDLRQTLKYLVDQVKSQLDVDAVDILIYHPNSQSLVYESGSGFNQDALAYRIPSRAKSLSDRVAAGNEIVFVPDLRNENNLNLGKILAEEGFISYYGVPLKIKDELKGVMEIFHRQPLQPDSEWLYFLEGLARQAAIAIDNATLFDDLLRKNAEMSQAYDATIVGWSRALELRDRETEGHAQRVTNTAVHLARKMGIRGEALIHVRRGALLHDIGKMGIPDSILHKPGPLSEDEWEIMRQHPTFAYALIYPIEFLRQAVEIPYCHHERWDGSGYPRNLIGNSIPLAARIFAIIDVWDALSSDRPYRPAWEKDRIIAYLQKQSGTHFDPDVVIAFMEILPELDF